jgi:hypothetical protein
LSDRADGQKRRRGITPCSVCLGHVPTVTGGADAPSLAGERDDEAPAAARAQGTADSGRPGAVTKARGDGRSILARMVIVAAVEAVWLGFLGWLAWRS